MSKYFLEEGKMKRTFGSLICTVLLLGLAVGAEAYSIRDDATGGDCTLIGTWNQTSKTCTLTADLSVAISDNAKCYRRSR